MKLMDTLSNIGASKNLTGWLCLSIFFFAAGLALHSGDDLRFYDEKDYHALAVKLIDEHKFTNEYGLPTAFRPPGYPIFLAFLAAFTSTAPVIAKIANAAALALSAWLLSGIATKISPTARNAVPLLIFAYPALFFTSTTLYPQTVGGLLLIITITQLSTSTLKSAFFAGIAYGTLILCIPSFLMLTPFFLVWEIFRNKKLTNSLIQSSIFTIAIAFIVIPWSTRNFIEMNAAIPVSTNSGVNLILGNSENARPNSGVQVDITKYEGEANTMSEVEQDKFYRRSAMQWVTKNPVEAAKLYSLKLLNHFNFTNSLATKSQQSNLNDLIMFLTYYFLLIMALSGFFLKRKKSNIEKLIVALYFLNAFMAAIFFTRIRFRLPFDLLLISLAAVNASYFLEALRARLKSYATPATAID